MFRWFFNPYTQLGFDALLVTAAELMLKKGATVCDSASTNVALAPVDSPLSLSSVLARPEAGDTAWFLDATQALETWTPLGA